MKITVSVPDHVFQAAESLAERLGIHRSELFSRALKAYVQGHKYDKLREALDDVYSEQSSGLDETLARMQWASLPREEMKLRRGDTYGNN